MRHIVVFASGSGTNFQAIIDAVQSGQINARISGFITDNPECKALQRAEQNDISTNILIPSGFEDKQAFANEMLKVLEGWKTDLIVLAGYLKKIPAPVIRKFENRIINIHPSLLPKYGGKGFYGLKVHQAVLDNGDSESGCTVHVVTEEYDKGPILEQQKVPVYNSDDTESLAQRILQQEHYLLPKVISQLIKDLNSKS